MYQYYTVIFYRLLIIKRNMWSLFGIVVSSIDGGHPIIDEMKNNCIGNIITKIVNNSCN